MIQIENLSKVFRTSEAETIALNHVSMEVRICCYHGTFRLRQIYSAEYFGITG